MLPVPTREAVEIMSALNDDNDSALSFGSRSARSDSGKRRTCTSLVRIEK